MAENIGTQIPTKIPSLSENADIQAALRLYHYGQDGNGVNFDPSSTGTLNPQSIAGYISSIQSDIQVIQDAGVGSIFAPSMPTAADGVEDGYIWVDSTQSLGAQPGLVAAYQTTAPSNPVIGTLWVDSTEENALKLKVYNGTTWKVIV